MVKVAHRYAEHARVAVRHVRRDGMDSLKKLEKAGEISEDYTRAQSELIQDLTDSTIKEIDDLLVSKSVKSRRIYGRTAAVNFFR
jgi:ribosome recycling factor